MVITTDSGTHALIYELALITAIFGLDWVSKKMDPCPTLRWSLTLSVVGEKLQR